MKDDILFGEPFVLNGSCDGIRQEGTLDEILRGCDVSASLETVPVDDLYNATECDAPAYQDRLLVGAEWGHYQLVDQTQRLCGERDMYCEQHPDDPSLCTFDDLGLPPQSLAVALGNKCRQSSEKNTHQRWKNAFLEAVMEKEGKVPGPGPSDIVIHLRVGDVIDGSSFSTEELLDKQRLYYPDDDGSVYVKPYAYYNEVISDEELQKADTVWIVAGAHAGWNAKMTAPRPFKSCKYVFALREYFEKRRPGKRPVELRLGQDPDADVLFTLQSQRFVQGGGGFSRTLAMLVEARGGTIYSVM